jgi:alpha-ketoglutarate-dependent 2,4-dichlorophenoxyacetate dioxygenase
MAIEVKPLHELFVGEVSGADLRRPQRAEEVAAIEAAMDRHAVLVFHDQDVTDEQQVAFSRNFGEIERAVGANVLKPGENRLSLDLADISNLDKDGRLRARDDRQRMFALGNQLWHSDSSFREWPAKYSLLSARRVPSAGGNTEFADMRAAYDALTPAEKAEVEELVCEHSLMVSRGALGFTEYTEEERRRFAPVRQRLVRTHPVTGRRSLFLASHAGGIVGWPVPEARAFLRDLTEHATQRRFVYAHAWRQGDLVMWDNRQTMHRARRYPETTEVRDMRRTTVAGEGPTVAQAAA